MAWPVRVKECHCQYLHISKRENLVKFLINKDDDLKDDFDVDFINNNRHLNIFRP